MVFLSLVVLVSPGLGYCLVRSVIGAEAKMSGCGLPGCFSEREGVNEVDAGSLFAMVANGIGIVLGYFVFVH